MNLEKRFEEFLQAGVYLRGWSRKTPPIYRRAFTSFQQSLQPGTSPIGPEPPIDKAQLEAWIVAMRQRGLSPAGCNMFMRAMNAFCSWLLEQGDLKAPIKLRQMKNHPKPVQVISEAEIRLLLSAKPKRLLHLRTWTLICVLLDTGCRIDEILSLTRDGVDFDNMVLVVRGKGNKFRRVPFSLEARKHLWSFCQRWQSRHPNSGLVFATTAGRPLSYRNTYRDVKACFAKAGVTGGHVHPHNLRHTFACTFAKRGGSVVALSRILGHSSITTTQGYLRGLQIQDFGEAAKLSPLARR